MQVSKLLWRWFVPYFFVVSFFVCATIILVNLLANHVPFGWTFASFVVDLYSVSLIVFVLPPFVDCVIDLINLL